MTVKQKTLNIKPKNRGFHLITREVTENLADIIEVKSGMLNLFLQHTSASLTINENASPDVRSDLEKHFNKAAPENAPYYDHTLEGADDMPAHIKSTTIGVSLNIPISNGRLALGTWQGIYLNEHRNSGGSRKIVATVIASED